MSIEKQVESKINRMVMLEIARSIGKNGGTATIQYINKESNIKISKIIDVLNEMSLFFHVEKISNNERLSIVRLSDEGDKQITPFFIKQARERFSV